MNPPTKNRACPYTPGSMACFTVTWPTAGTNLCNDCGWWDDFCTCKTCGNIECTCYQKNDGLVCEERDEYYCQECDGHNRCEDEMDAGFETVVYDDPMGER